MKFSQRYGHAPVPKALLPESMPDDLRNTLWNVLQQVVWDKRGFMFEIDGYEGEDGIGLIERFSSEFWFATKQRISAIPSHPKLIMASLQEQFFTCEWHGVYDFLEVTMDIVQSRELEARIDRALTAEKAAYRLIDRRFVQITDPGEIAALTEAVELEDAFKPVSVHLRRAVELYSDRTAPDYRNSIKESISAVEAMAKLVSAKSDATLGDALTALERAGKLHGALKRGFSALYGYTSEADGIRHASMDEPNLNAADAKFFVLVCASFVNYLKARA